MFGGNFAPVGWNFCDGTVLPIADYTTLYNLIGTTYGGNGTTTFRLPDLRGRLPIHQGSGFVIGAKGGVERVKLTVEEIPAHTHAAGAQSAGGSSSSPSGAVWAGSNVDEYSTNSSNATMHSRAIGETGGSHHHNNIMPYLCVNFIISLFGIYPSQA
jgi:microcystin-dependent protein